MFVKYLIFFILAFESANLCAFFSDYMYDSKIMGMGLSGSAYESVFSFKYNPALAGAVRDPSVAISHSGSHFSASSNEKIRTISFDAVVPSRIKIWNMSYSLDYSSVYGEEYDQRVISLGAASWHLRDFGEESLDGGINLKSLSLKGPNGISESKMAADIGAVFRLRDYQIGFSILNFNAPTFSQSKAKAAKTMKFSLAKIREDYSLCADLSKRDFPDNNYTISAGAERFFRLYEGGVILAYAGLGAGDNKTFASFGGGYKKMSYEIAYSFSLPLNGAMSIANSVSFSFRFGSNDEETEYQKLISMEMKYRRDLMTSLDRSEGERVRLQKELHQMREEIERLYEIIKKEKGKVSELEESRKKLSDIVKRHNQSQEELRLLEEKRRQERLKQIEENYQLDWKNYIKMKNSNASKAALKGYVQKIISQYQGLGVDISEAALEMQYLSGD